MDYTGVNNKRGVKVDINEVETYKDLQAWIVQFLPEATVQLSDNDVIIKTGLDVAMGGYLYPIREKNE
jgi:hypothetical protein